MRACLREVVLQYPSKMYRICLCAKMNVWEMFDIRSGSRLLKYCGRNPSLSPRLRESSLPPPHTDSHTDSSSL